MANNLYNNSLSEKLQFTAYRLHTATRIKIAFLQRETQNQCSHSVASYLLYHAYRVNTFFSFLFFFSRRKWMVRCILQRQNSPGDVIERLYKIEIYRCTWQRNKHQIFDLKLLYRGCVKIRHIDMRNRCKKISHFRPTYTFNSFIKHWTRKNWHLNIGEVLLVGNRKSTVNHTTFSFFFFFFPTDHCIRLSTTTETSVSHNSTAIFSFFLPPLSSFFPPVLFTIRSLFLFFFIQFPSKRNISSGCACTLFLAIRITNHVARNLKRRDI